MMGRTTSFRGSFTALVTPFQNGTVDERAFRALVVWQIDEGTNGLVPVGTTGEIPTLSVIDMSVDTMQRLYELENIAGVKDATASMVRVSQQRATLGPEFNQLSGEDATALGFMAHGGHGCISVTSNVAPRLCAEFQHACLNGDYATALSLQDKLMPLHSALFIET